jgi:PAS domain-containing protein
MFEREGAVSNFEVKRRRENGEEWWSLLNVRSIEFGGEMARVNWVIDISERREAEAELGEKEAQLRTALDALSGGLFMIDKDLNFQLWNDRVIELYELPDGIMRMGLPLSDLIRLRAERGDFGPGDVETQIEQRIEGYGDSSIRHFEDHMPSGRVIDLVRAPTASGGIVAICNDVTERRQAEEELREKLEELEQFNKLAVGRELRMIDLKKEINDLLQGMGKDSEYEIVE